MPKQSSPLALVQSMRQPGCPAWPWRRGRTPVQPQEGTGFWGPTVEPHLLSCAGGTSGTGAGGLSAARGAGSNPCPQGQHLSEGWQEDAPSQLWGWPCPQQGVPLALSPRLCWQRGQHAWSPVLGGSSRRTPSLCQRGAGGALYPGCPCAWAAEGPGAGGGQRLSAC